MYSQGICSAAGCGIPCRHSQKKNAGEWVPGAAADCVQGLPGLHAEHGADRGAALILPGLHCQLHQDRS